MDDDPAAAQYEAHAAELVRFAAVVGTPSTADDIVSTVTMRVLVERDDWRDIDNLQAPANAEPTGLATEDGVRVGDPVEAIPLGPNTSTEEPFGRGRSRVTVSSANPDHRPGGVAPESRFGVYVIRDGAVTGLEGQTFTC